MHADVKRINMINYQVCMICCVNLDQDNDACMYTGVMAVS